MVRQMIPTKDGSFTIAVPGMNATYHSIHGAIRESQHVFIEAGLRYASERLNRPVTLHLLEIGLGTGLNALLSLMEIEKMQYQIHYTAIEPFPLLTQEIAGLNYCERLNRPDLLEVFTLLHACEWEKDIPLNTFFTIHKTRQSLLHFTMTNHYHLVYYDAFAPASQPELWTQDVFEKIYKMLFPNAVLVTYCSKGDVRRAMINAGFTVEKIPGPPGKREMLRASSI